MIQRKQTVFLLLAVVLAIVCVVIDPTWLDTLQAAVATLAGYTIFIFKKRMRQALFCLIDGIGKAVAFAVSHTGPAADA